jgi:hypothetical protein
MRPSVGAISAAIMRIRVVLPAPSGPTRPVRRPVSIAASTPASAVISPKRLTTPTISTAELTAYSPPFARGTSTVTGIPWRRRLSASVTTIRRR